MMMKTWHWAIVTSGIALCLLLVVTGPGANSVANLSDYYHWLLDSVCKDKTRLECYDDFPVFLYHGRHYDIGVAFF